jgi:hypothetical protein
MNKHNEKPPLKVVQLVDYRADLLNLKAAFKLELLHLSGGADQAAAAEGEHSYQLGKLIWQSYFTSQFQFNW